MLAIVVILLPLAFFGFRIFEEAQSLYSHISAGNVGIFTEFLNTQLGKIAPWLTIDFNKYLQEALGVIAGSLGMIFSKVADSTIKLLLALFAFYYFLKDAEKLKKTVLRLSPLSVDKSKKIISKMLAMADSVIKGSLIIAIAQGFLVGLGFFLFGLPNPVLWGSVAVVASLIPILGVGLIVIPGIVSLIIMGNIPSLIGFVLWSVLVVGLIDNFLRPVLIERDLHIHPLLIFFSVLGGLSIFGATGLLLGPLALSLFLALLEIYPIILREGEEKL
jgi:predicted PurR-regulated permease PerM